jgi:hypothetical protein
MLVRAIVPWEQFKDRVREAAGVVPGSVLSRIGWALCYHRRLTARTERSSAADRRAENGAGARGSGPGWKPRAATVRT